MNDDTKKNERNCCKRKHIEGLINIHKKINKINESNNKMILIFLKHHCKTNEEHCDQSAAELPFLSFVTHVITSRRKMQPRGHSSHNGVWGQAESSIVSN